MCLGRPVPVQGSDAGVSELLGSVIFQQPSIVMSKQSADGEMSDIIETVVFWKY
jgi:hypothetical protein